MTVRPPLVFSDRSAGRARNPLIALAADPRRSCDYDSSRLAPGAPRRWPGAKEFLAEQLGSRRIMPLGAAYFPSAGITAERVLAKLGAATLRELVPGRSASGSGPQCTRARLLLHCAALLERYSSMAGAIDPGGP
jgi:hypothetical protein